MIRRICRTTTMKILSLIAVAIVGSSARAAIWSKEYKSGIVWPQPSIVDPGEPATPPADAIVLFDGNDLSQWNGGDEWRIHDGYAEVHGSSITTKQKFGDCQLHIEFATPEVVKGNGQGRGNSGVYLMNQYELQIIDSYDNTTYFDGHCASNYKQQPPMVNACRQPGEWQTYDIVFTAPRFAPDGRLERPATMTVLHNGVLIHNHVALLGPTVFIGEPEYEAHESKLPLTLQDHGNLVSFRNIWIRELRD